MTEMTGRAGSPRKGCPGRPEGEAVAERMSGTTGGRGRCGKNVRDNREGTACRGKDVRDDRRERPPWEGYPVCPGGNGRCGTDARISGTTGGRVRRGRTVP